MSDIEEILLKKALTFFKEEIEKPEKIEELLSLPCYVLKEIPEEISGKLKAEMNINSLKELAEVDLDQQREHIKQLKLNFSNFEKWVLTAKIITRISNYEVSGAKKIALIGLENAGKTAMREVILRKYQINQSLFNRIIRKLQPTKGVEREKFSVLESDLQLWDMGGQETYRENYLREPERFLMNVDVVLYVIDVQDSNKHNATINYLNKLAATFQSINETPFFIICYHKYDPDIRDDQKYRDWIKNSWKIITQIMDEHDFPRKKLISSIYDDITIFNAFSEAVKIASDYNITKIISKILEQHAQEAGLENLILLSSNGMELGEYVKNGTEDSELLEQIYQCAIHTMNSINQLNEINKLMKAKKYVKDILYTFYTGDLNFIMTRVLLLNKSIYLATMHPKKKELDLKITRNLMPWLSNLFI